MASGKDVMEIDWKHVASTPGYRSLKAAYVADIQRGWRSKAKSLRLFNWVINRARHYAHVQQRPIEDVLNEWEERRNQWWVGYYQAANQPKLCSGVKALVE